MPRTKVINESVSVLAEPVPASEEKHGSEFCDSDHAWDQTESMGVSRMGDETRGQHQPEEVIKGEQRNCTVGLILQKVLGGSPNLC